MYTKLLCYSLMILEQAKIKGQSLPCIKCYTRQEVACHRKILARTAVVLQQLNLKLRGWIFYYLPPLSFLQ
jgi:hypothetical protein